jgi:hypothetical protein
LGGFVGNIYGNRGGSNTTTRSGNLTNASGGGGAGSAALDTNPNGNAGNGGNGIKNNITGVDTYYGGGGGGGGHLASAGLGGIGGGGNGGTIGAGVSGTANTGGGGGGGAWYDFLGGNGGSGIVIISFKADNHYYPYNIGEWVYNDYNTDTYYLGRVGINNFNPTSELHVNGNTFSTSYLGGSKTFKIEHPLNIKDKYLYHGCVEGPRFDNIYRGKKIIKNGRGEVIIDKECNTTGGMSLGTFLELNTNYHLYLQNNETFDSVKGYIENGKIIIYSKNIIDEIEIDWMVFGERKDAEIRKSLITDSEGRLICEHNI